MLGRITKALALRYQSPEWAVLYEVANGTGAHQRRWADAVAINCYPSRGLSVHGFEFKISRSDWLRELKDPDKSVDVQRYCDFWFIVTLPDIVKPGELPATWGLMEVKTDRIRVINPAPQLKPEPLTRAFLASLARSMGKNIASQVAKAIQPKIDEALKSKIAIIEANKQHEIDRRTRKYAEIEKKLEEIKQATGIDLLSWTGTDEISAAIKFAMSAGIGGNYNSIRTLVKEFDQHSKRLIQAITDAGIPLE